MKHTEILHRCFRCGYCKLPGNYIDFNCPAYAAFRFESYSPGGRMWLLRAWLDDKLEPSRRFQEILFSCTACRNCVEQCALTRIKDELLLAFIAGKGELVGEGKVPPPVRDCLTRLQQYGNPYGLARKKRSNWAVDAEVEEFLDQEFLFFPGDVGVFVHLLRAQCLERVQSLVHVCLILSIKIAPATLTLSESKPCAILMLTG